MAGIPKVSVLMPVHNGAEYLREAVESVLSQTFRDLELIVIDDASTDESAAILGTFTDGRIVRLSNPTNLGQPRSRNRGLEAARGLYVASLDCDDVATPSRIAEQVAYLDENPDVTVLGTSVTFIDRSGAVDGEDNPPSDPAVLAWLFIAQSPIWHPSTMVRRDSILALGGYDPEYTSAQDYELWTRVLQAGGQVHNLPRNLTRYRRWPGQITHRRREEQERNSRRIATRFMSWLLGEPVQQTVGSWLRDLHLGLPASGHVDELRRVMEVVARTADRCTERFDPGGAACETVREHARLFVWSLVGRVERSDPRLAAELARAMVLSGLADPLDLGILRLVEGRLPPRVLHSYRNGYLRPVRRAVRLTAQVARLATGRETLQRRIHLAGARVDLARKQREWRTRRRDDPRSAPGRKVILVVLMERLGDIIAAEPLARSLRARDPDATIVWLVDEPFRPLVAHNPHIDEVLSVRCVGEVGPLMASGAFNQVVNLHIGPKKCRGCEQYLFPSRGIHDVSPVNYYGFGPLLHVFGRMAGLPPSDEGPRLYAPSLDPARIEALRLPERFVTIHGATREGERDWTPERWQQLGRMIVEQYRIPIVEIGDRPVLDHSTPGAVDLCGRLAIEETAEVLRRSGLFIGVDSGPAHVANAVGTFGVILLGQFRSFQRYIPYTGGYGDGSNAVLIHHVGAVKDISVETVFSHVRERLGMLSPDGRATRLGTRPATRIPGTAAGED